MRHISTYRLFESDGREYVLDSKGEPLVLYHGARQKFDAFDMSWFGQTDDGFYGRGFYLTPERDYAEEFGTHLAKCNIRASSVFWLRDWGTVGSPVELDLRDDLAKLKGMPSDLKTDRELPSGYYVKRSERQYRSDDVVVFEVAPKKELYGTDKEVYGEDLTVLKEPLVRNPHLEDMYREKAIVLFNDEQKGVSYDEGLPNWFLQKVGRDDLTEVLENNGHDCLAIGRPVNGKDRPKPEDMGEYLIWNPEQIEIVEWVK